MKKSRTNNKLQTLEIKREILLNLSHSMLTDVGGGFIDIEWEAENVNKTTRKSQCPTLCF